jgi:hypothetical protein
MRGERVGCRPAMVRPAMMSRIPAARNAGKAGLQAGRLRSQESEKTMSMLSHFLTHVFGKKTYDEIATMAKALAIEQLRAQESWMRARLTKAGMDPAMAVVVSGEIVGRIIAAMEK